MAAMNQQLVTSLQQLPAPGMVEAVAMGVGYSAEQLADPSAVAVVGFHLLQTDTLCAAYVITPHALTLVEATSDARSFTLTVPLNRIRRVARFEDRQSTRVVIELDADKSTTVAQAQDDGTVTETTTPAGYELAEWDPTMRRSLQRLQIALSNVLNRT